MTTGIVREWYSDDGWGVIDSAETPGGGWAHFSDVRMDGYRALTIGQAVDFDWEMPSGGQDGYAYRATVVNPQPT